MSNPINLENLVVGSTVNGLIHVSSYTAKAANSQSKAPMSGTATYRGKVTVFKTWDAQINKIFADNDLNGSVVEVVGTVGVYNGGIEITLTSARLYEGDIDVTIFYKTADVETLFTEFSGFVNTCLSTPAINVLLGIFGSDNLYEPFKKTFAGIRMHDAQVGGLLNHTMKMLRLARTLVENDHRLEPWRDLLYLNIILHDIGKVHELKGASYTPNSFVTHRTMGLEITVKNKELVIEHLGETFYYHILAVQQGHHGEFGDPPTTIWAYIIHLIDMLECNTTGFLDNLERGDFSIKDGQRTVWNHGKHLVV